MIVSVDIHVADNLSAGTPRQLFVLQPGAVFSNVRYEVDVKRGRFLVPRIVGENAPDTPITVVLNWWVEFVNRMD